MGAYRASCNVLKINIREIAAGESEPWHFSTKYPHLRPQRDIAQENHRKKTAGRNQRSIVLSFT